MKRRLKKCLGAIILSGVFFVSNVVIYPTFAATYTQQEQDYLKDYGSICTNILNQFRSVSSTGGDLTTVAFVSNELKKAKNQLNGLSCPSKFIELKNKTVEYFDSLIAFCDYTVSVANNLESYNEKKFNSLVDDYKAKSEELEKIVPSLSSEDTVPVQISSTITSSTANAEGVIKDGRTLVPVRGVFESLGFSVNWDSATNKASISDSKHEVAIYKNASYFYADSKEYHPDVPAQIIDGSMYLPLRSIGEAVGADISWDAETKTAKIGYEGKIVNVKCKVVEQSQNTNSNITKEKLLKICEANKSLFAEKAHLAVKYSSAQIDSVIAESLKYPNTATFQDEDKYVIITGANIIANSEYFQKYPLSRYGRSQKYSVYYNGYVTSQLPNGNMKQVSYTVELVFDLDANNKPTNIEAYHATIYD